MGKYLLEKQRKLTAACLGAALLLGGLFVPCDAAKYSAFSLAVAGLFSILVGSHAYQTAKTQPGA